MKKILYRTAIVLLMIMVSVNTYFDNSCYLKVQFELQQTISNLTVLVGRIKSLEGYKDTLPVCFVTKGKTDATYKRISELTDIGITRYDKIFPHGDNSLRRRHLLNDLEYWCGFAPKIVAQKKFENLDEVKKMPDYPDAGSVKIINDTVVVKW